MVVLPIFPFAISRVIQANNIKEVENIPTFIELIHCKTALYSLVSNELTAICLTSLSSLLLTEISFSSESLPSVLLSNSQG